MADKPAAERTEQPTSRRITRARGKGRVPQSEELTSLVSLVVLMATVAFLGPNLIDWMLDQARQGMSCDTAPLTNSDAFIHFINTKIVDMTILILPILLALTISGVAAGIVVGGGFNFAPAALQFKFDILNPVSGFGNLVNTRSLVKLVTSILKLFFIGGIAWYYLHNKLDMFADLRWAWSLQILSVIGKIIFGLMIRICLALLLVALGDVIFQKWKYKKDLMMTKQEVKEERKQTEGSPEVKKRIRQLQFQSVLKRMMQEVPKADVVLVNPTHVAVALRYDAKTMEAPILVARGADEVAEKIREIARAYGVPIIRRPELARSIFSTVKLNASIPDTLYVAVAEVLAMLHRLRQKRR